jgi:serine/threonine protein kinase
MVIPILSFCNQLYLHSVSAQWVNKGPTKKTLTDGLCAPEVILGADIDTKVDVWALGCMVGFAVLLLFKPIPYLSIAQTFELLTGCSLFSPQASQTGRGDDHLAKMVMMGEPLSKTSPLASLKFNEG